MQKANRLISLDVFRGITIVLMIIVNSPGNRVAYSWLEHSGWNGCSLADLVFPFFIIIAGISSVLALSDLKMKGASTGSQLQKVIKRSIYIFGMGLILNAFPHHLNFVDIRILGVLQRIAICYLFSSILFLTTRKQTQIMIMFVLLIGYWLFLACFSIHGSMPIDNNIIGYVDQLLLSSNHLYTPTFDPEGLLSTIPAIASALLGNIIGFCLISSRTNQQKLRWLVWASFLLLLAGWLWGAVFPINKSIWSSSYVLWTGGWACFVFAICFALIEIHKWTTWSKSFSVFGKSAMLVYMLHVFFLKVQALILMHDRAGDVVSLRLYITDLCFGFVNPYNASLLYALSYTLFWFFILKVLSNVRSPKSRTEPISSLTG